MLLDLFLVRFFSLISTRFGYKKISATGRAGGTGPPNVNLGPPKISETTRARMLKLKTQLYIVK